MVLFPTSQRCRSQRRDLYSVRMSFNRIVGRMRGLARTAQSWDAAPRLAPAGAPALTVGSQLASPIGLMHPKKR